MSTPLSSGFLALLALGPSLQEATPLPDGHPHPNGARAAERDPFFAALPAESVLTLTTEPLAQLRAVWGQSTWSRFLADPGFDGIERWILGMWDQAGLPAARTELLPWRVLAGVEGRVGAFLAPTDEVGELATGFLLEAAPGAWELLLAALADEDGFEALSMEPGETVRARSISAFDTSEVVLARTGELVVLVFAPDADDALGVTRDLLDRATRSDAPRGLESAPAYRDAVRGTSPAAAQLVLSLQELIRALEGETSTEERERLALIGLDRMRWIATEVRLGTGEELEFALRIDLPEGGLIADLAGFLGPLPHAELALLPAQSMNVSLASFDVWGTYRRVVDFLSANFPKEYGELRNGLDQVETISGIDVEGDLISQITGRFASFSMPLPHDEVFGSLPLVDVSPDSILNQGGGWIIGLRDTDPVEDVLYQLLDVVGLGLNVDVRDVAGVDVESLDLGISRLSWAFVDEHLLLSEYPTAMRAMIERITGVEEKSAADRELFQVALAAVPKASVLSVTETRVSVETLLESFRLMDEVLKMTGGMLEGEMFPAFLNAIPWPEPGIAKDHFQGTVGASVSRQAGALELRLRSRSR